MSRFLAYVSTTVAVLAIVLGAAAFLLEDRIGAHALEAARGQLVTPISSERTTISFLRDFPHITLALENVLLQGVETDTLLQAKQVAGRLRWADLLFGDTYRIERISIRAGTLNLYRPQRGPQNWMVLRSAGEDSNTESFSFEIQEIAFRDVHISYRDEVSSTALETDISRGSIGGAFGRDAYTITGQLHGHNQYFTLDELRFFEGTPVDLALQLEVLPQDNRYRFGPTTLTLDQMPVDLSGTIGFIDESTTYNLQLATQHGELGSLIRLLPDAYVSPALRQLNSTGTFTLEGTVKGILDEHQSPALNFEGALRQGTVSVPGLRRSAQDVSFGLSYTNGKARRLATSTLRLDDIRARLDDEPMQGSIRLSDFDNPKLHLSANGKVPANWFDELLPQSTLDGTIRVDNLTLDGRLRHLRTAAGQRYVTSSGTFASSDLRINLPSASIQVRAPKFIFANGTLRSERCSVASFGDDISGSIQIQHLLPYLLGSADEHLDFSGQLHTASIHLDKWVAALSESPDEKSSSAAIRSDYHLDRQLRGTVSFEAQRVFYHDIRASRATGTLALRDSKVNFNAEAYAAEGHWQADGVLTFAEQLRLATTLACSEINITELFEQTENLGQEVLAADNISGTMTARAFIEAEWNEKGDLDYDKLHVWSNVGLMDGSLNNVEMLQSLSRFIRSQELREVKFIDVENWIEVDRQTVYLPAMFVRSSASNFTVAGSHSFEHDIDYSLRVNGAQVLFSKLFGKRPDVTFFPDRRRGLLNAGFTIQGNLENDDYAVRMAGKKVKRHFEQSQHRKAAIRKKLGSYFDLERLIDNYDQEGRRLGTAAAQQPAQAAGPQRAPLFGRAVAEKLADATVSDSLLTEICDPAIRRAALRARQKRSEQLGKLFGPQRGSQTEQPVEEEEYLEGFEDF